MFICSVAQSAASPTTVVNFPCLVYRHLSICIKMLFFRLCYRFFDIFTFVSRSSVFVPLALLKLFQIWFLSLMIHSLELMERIVKLIVVLTIDLIHNSWFANIHFFSGFRTRDFIFNLNRCSWRHSLNLSLIVITCHELANAVSASVIVRNFRIVHA